MLIWLNFTLLSIVSDELLSRFPPPASTHEFEEAEVQAAYSQGNLTAMEHSGERCTHDCRARGSRKKSQKRVKVD